MKIHRYVVFQTEDLARDLLVEVDRSRDGDRWAEPVINPFDGRAVVPWNDDVLSEHAGLIEGLESLSHDEAQEEGWALGYFKGRFAKARLKLEEAQHIRPVLDTFDRSPNYAAYRALFFGLLSSLYGVKEALRQACERTGTEARDWWNERFLEIRSDPLLRLLYELNNDDKHSIASPLLRPRMKLYGYQGPAPPGLILSGEGVFVLTEVGTARERRVFFEGADAQFEVRLDVPELEHKGRDVTGIGLNAQLDLAISCYEDYVFEARARFD